MRTISKEEYKALRDEINMRIQLMNTHNIGMITAVFAAWAIVGVIIKDYTEVDIHSTTLFALYSFLIPFLLIAPIGIIMPLAVKSGDNVGQIISIAGYLKLYAEMPSIMDESDSGFIGWESLQKKAIAHKSNAKLFNCEYIVLSIMSLGLFVATAVIICCYIYPENIGMMWGMFAVYIVLMSIGIVGVVFVWHNSSYAKFIKNMRNTYKQYCESAKNMGFATNVEIEDFNNMINGGNMSKNNKNMFSESVIKLREMMCSGKLYNPLTWRYCDGDICPCGNVDCGDIMKKYQILCRQSMEKYNSLPQTESAEEKRQKLLTDIFGENDSFRRIEAPFHANYGGKHTILRGTFYAGFNLTLIEDGQIEIGDKTMIGPNVTICTAEHPIDIATRNKGQGILFNKKVTIGNNVWIGANVTILAGVTIGDNCVIGANSVITKDTVIPDNKIAVGVISPKSVTTLKSIS